MYVTSMLTVSILLEAMTVCVRVDILEMALHALVGQHTYHIYYRDDYVCI